MTLIRDTINRLRPCPNEFDIKFTNSQLPERRNLFELLQQGLERREEALRFAETAHELADGLDRIVDETADEELARLSGQIEAHAGMIEAINRPDLPELQDPVQWATEKMGGMACALCGGVIVDPETGIAYCGRTTPAHLQVDSSS